LRAICQRKRFDPEVNALSLTLCAAMAVLGPIAAAEAQEIPVYLGAKLIMEIE
jgi:hypothetical protein